MRTPTPKREAKPQAMPPLPLERAPRQQPGASLVVRYFMIPCNVCLILLATSTLGFAVLLFLNNCTWQLGGARVALLLLAKSCFQGRQDHNQARGHNQLG